MAKIDLTSSAKLFRSIVSAREGKRLHANGGLSYSCRLRELLLAMIVQMGWDPMLFGSTESEREGLLQLLTQVFLN